ncbi:MAG: SpoIIIAH-like family protein [Firmicutes bacterium]|jgi:predicted CopG family antitoxin|nr:SpoIIIAH-like family protein [Bacillota bacterium]HOB22558.1 SpoIIIAH-like family protein [Bacillota bacterium]HQD40597.1 SpoIIIAH-like family protein [Bacillota bacterium]
MKLVFWRKNPYLGAGVLIWLVAFLILGLAMLRQPHTKDVVIEEEVQDTIGKEKKEPNPFASLRIQRERRRDEQLELLTRSGKTEEAEKLTEQKRLESELEGMLKAMGFPEAVVLVGSREASVVVAAVLTELEVARIGEVVARKTGFPLEKITISEGAAVK